MRTPSSQTCRLDLVPPLADRFILGFPIDYGPVLLLMPFGFHLAVDTLPSGVQQAVAPGQSWLYPAFAFVPVWTSPYLPPSPASEAVNPTFGYGAPHLSARGTSTLLNSALLSAHFLLADQPDIARRQAFTDPGSDGGTRTKRCEVYSRRVELCALGVPKPGTPTSAWLVPPRPNPTASICATPPLLTDVRAAGGCAK